MIGAVDSRECALSVEKMTEDGIELGLCGVGFVVIYTFQGRIAVHRYTIRTVTHDRAFILHVSLCIPDISQMMHADLTILLVKIIKVNMPVTFGGMVYRVPIRHSSHEWTGVFCEWMKS